MNCPICNTTDYYDGVFGGNCINSNCHLFKNGKASNLIQFEEGTFVKEGSNTKCVIDFATQQTYIHNHAAWKVKDSPLTAFLIWIYDQPNGPLLVEMSFRVKQAGRFWTNALPENERFNISISKKYTVAEATLIVNLIFKAYGVNPKDYCELSSIK